MDESTAKLVGMVLVALGLMDPLLGVLLIGPRIEDRSKRSIVVGSLVLSGLLMMGLGVMFLMGVFGGLSGGASRPG